MRFQPVALVAFAAVLNIGCDANRAMPVPGGPYPPVTAEHLVGSTNTHRDPYGNVEYTWSFYETRFLIEGVAIPPDLIMNMLGEGKTATKIEGSWEIRNRMIHFTVEPIDDDAIRESSMRIYGTGPIRIESSSQQYVFPRSNASSTNERRNRPGAAIPDGSIDVT